MSKMITSRVPDELYTQVTVCLESLGLTTSDLIRAAYEYVLKTGNIPNASSVHEKRGDKVSSEALADFKKKFSASRLNVKLPEDFDYKKELAEGKWSDYEALA